MGHDVVVITDSDLPDDGIPEAILGAAGIAVRRAACRTPEDVIRQARDASALIVQWAPITDAVLAELRACRFVSRLGIGYDMIDVDAATARGVAVANTPDYCVEEVAAHTMALALSLCRRVVDLDRAVRLGRWSVTEDGAAACRPSRTVFAVVGYGRIGRRVARTARAAGFDVVVHDPGVSPGVIAADGLRALSLADALACADILSLHVPLTEATRGLIDERALRSMRPGSYVVNTCRGELIDEDALARLLRSGHLGGAALDVFRREPLPDPHPLRSAPNLLLTPHAAWYSPAAVAELPTRAAEQVVAFLAGRRVDSIVNPGYAARARSAGAPADAG
ncbi:MAG TPA: C-terminal binding protein [Acidimicrobiales bacterium]